jgi:dienelactone hydrolase
VKRSGPYEPQDPKLFGDPELRQAWFAKFIGTATPANVMSDMHAFLAFLDAQPDVKPPKLGTTGWHDACV